MGQCFCKPKYHHENLLGAFHYNPSNPYDGCSCKRSRWNDWAPAAFRFKDPEWKKGTAMRNELYELLDGAMEKAKEVVKFDPFVCTCSCWGSVTPELVREFNKQLCAKNKLSDMGLQFNAGQSV